MNARNINVHWFQGPGRLIVTLAALLFVTALAACSDATPAAGPTAVLPHAFSHNRRLPHNSGGDNPDRRGHDPYPYRGSAPGQRAGPNG